MHNSDMEKYEWSITIGIEKHWVTTEEKDFYLKCINNGEVLVALRGGTILLGKNVQQIAHCKALELSRQIEEYRKEGKYQCDYGEWHPNGVECKHNVKLIENGDNFVMVEREPQDLLPAPQPQPKRQPQLSFQSKGF
jgi:hypothetical protein